jgi:DNA repair photolyase
MLFAMELFRREDFQQWGSTGGKLSHRRLPRSVARQMALKSAEARKNGGKQRQPKEKKPHGTQEWASHNINIQLGCEHDCRYCYAKSMGIRFQRATSKSWRKPIILKDKVEQNYRKLNGRIMFPTSHDITPLNINECSSVLQRLLQAGNEVLIVSKPHLSCIKTLCNDLLPCRTKVMFRFTIGSANDAVLSFWEPEAPPYKERIASLKWAYEQGYRTSVSSEPMLDEHVSRVVAEVKPFITDSVWLGRVNKLANALTMNCPNRKDIRRTAEEMMQIQTDEWVLGLYEQYKSDNFIKWKDSIKKVVGIQRPTAVGLDI